MSPAPPRFSSTGEGIPGHQHRFGIRRLWQLIEDPEPDAISSSPQAVRILMVKRAYIRL